MRNWDIARMRRNGDEVHLIQLVECVVGSQMIVLVDLRVSNVVMTRRRSTEVLQIVELPDAGEVAGRGWQ